MKPALFKIGLFSKYKEDIAEINKKTIQVGTITFVAVTVIDWIFRAFIRDDSVVNFAFVGYDLIAILLFVCLHFMFDKVKHITSFICTIWYILCFAYAFHVFFIFQPSVAVLTYCLICISLSVMILTSFLKLILFQAAGTALVCVAISLSSPKGRSTSLMMLEVIIAGLISVIVGLLIIYVRMENLIFEKELSLFAGNEDESFVTAFDGDEWQGRSKYKILSGEVDVSRKVFSFVYSISKDRIISIRAKNPFNLKVGMNIESIKEGFVAKALEPMSRARITKLFDMNSISGQYREGKKHHAIIAGFRLNNRKPMWLDIECFIKEHPVTGDFIASFVIEDISEERLLMGVLNKIMEQNYDYVMCVEREKNGTLTFKADKNTEIFGAYGEEYYVEMSKYIRENVDPHDIEKARLATDLTVADANIKQNGIHEFLLDEKDDYGLTKKKLFQYSYMDPAKNFLCIIKQDVTEVIEKEDAAKARLAKALKERENAMNARNEFLTRMSHEMRTPMNAILGLTALMKDEVNNPEVMNDYIEKVQYSGKFLLQLINDVLDISKISQKKFQINKVPYSFGEFWEAVNMLIEPMCASKTVDFEWKSSIPEDYVVLTDPLRITQVFINLLSNAIKYTPAGGHILFECKQKELEGGNAKVTFVVKDDGIGMSDEFQKRMFEPFQQESKDVNSELNGTGLGLSIVKAIIDAMKGKITVNSAPGAGTTIKVVLDFEIAKDSPAHMIKYEDADLNGKRILVVEDNDINREIAVALLEKKGMIAETAVNGQDAMEKFSSHTPGHYDLILMDIRMPVMSGLKATKFIRAMERDDARQIPIIAMTANAFNKDVQASLDAGMNEHLSKPIEPRSLYNTIAKYVSKK